MKTSTHTIISIQPNIYTYSSSCFLSKEGNHLRKIRNKYKSYFISELQENVEFEGRIYHVIYITLGSLFQRTNGLSDIEREKIQKSIITNLNFNYDFPDFYQDYMDSYFLKKEITDSKENFG